ncbi:hypothetical protein T492DRAFT_917785 [Pavlovales sp. CCMP2436]|nr:hypothetical protein T492DRAFT_917785 [Pavlovales sp. CCMP2436]
MEVADSSAYNSFARQPIGLPRERERDPAASRPARLPLAPIYSTVDPIPGTADVTELSRGSGACPQADTATGAGQRRRRRPRWTLGATPTLAPRRVVAHACELAAAWPLGMLPSEALADPPPAFRTVSAKSAKSSTTTFCAGIEYGWAPSSHPGARMQGLAMRGRRMQGLAAAAVAALLLYDALRGQRGGADAALGKPTLAALNAGADTLEVVIAPPATDSRRLVLAKFDLAPDYPRARYHGALRGIPTRPPDGTVATEGSKDFSTCAPTSEKKLHYFASRKTMQQAKKQTQTVLAIQRQHVIKLGRLPGVTGVNVKVDGVETQIFFTKQPQYKEQREGPRNQSRTQLYAPPPPATPPAAMMSTTAPISEEKPPLSPRDAVLARLAETARIDLSVAEVAYDDAKGDADKTAEKAAALRKAAEEETATGWAADELLAKAAEAAEAQHKALIRRGNNAAAQEKRTKAAEAKATEAKAEQHTDSHEQKEPHVGVNIAGHKTQPKTKGTGKKDNASAAAPTLKPTKPAATDPGLSAVN